MALDLKQIINVKDNSGNNILDSISGPNTTFMTGVDDLINQNLTPIVTGYSFIYWVSLPSWFEKDPDLKYFKELSQKNFRSFQGVTDIELNTIQHQTGFAGHNFDIPGNIQRSNEDFTIGHKEYSGGVMTNMYYKWISYIRDPRTNIALYPKVFDTEYSLKNHSGELLYCMVRPDATNTNKNIIEYAAYYTNVFPTNIPLSTLYNYEMGNQDSPTIDINFKGFVEIGPDVNKYAQKILAEKILKTADNSGISFLDTLGTNDTAINVIKNGANSALKDIYGA